MSMDGPLEGHKVGCWYRNGGPDCTCTRRTAKRASLDRILIRNAEKGDDMLEKIKRFDPLGGMQLEDAMVLSTFVRQLEAEYETLKVEKPDWLKEQTTRLRRFIEDMVRDARKKQISALRARLDALKTPTERRAELERMLAELESTEK